MRKYMRYLVAVSIICLLAGCGNKTTSNEIASNEATSNEKEDKATSSEKQTIDKEDSKKDNKKEQEYLFEAKEMDTIQLTGQEILDGKEANMSVKISEDINMDFHISRDNPNGTKLYAIYNSQAINLAENYISPYVFDDDEAIPSYYYQICCYDFNKDGLKEVLIACGNKNDELSIFLFDVLSYTEQLFSAINYIRGFDTANVNGYNEICVPSEKGVKSYKYDVQAQDPEYARLSGPIKVSVDYALEEQLSKFKNVNEFVINEDGMSLLILPTEELTNFSIHNIEMDETTLEFFTVSKLYELPVVTPDEPVIIKLYMPDFPCIGITYTDESGMIQECGIAESLKDGSIFLFEMYPEGAISE